MSEWLPIESASCVGKKRHLFHLKSGKIVVGWRISGSNYVVPEKTKERFLATHYIPLPLPPAKGASHD